MKKIEKVLLFIGLSIFAYGVYEISIFQSAYEYENMPIYFASMGHIGEIYNSKPYLIPLTVFVPSILFSIAIFITLHRHNKRSDSDV